MKKFTNSLYKYLVLVAAISMSFSISGQQLVKDIWQGSGNSSPSDFAVFNGKLYFSANDSTHGKEVWVTDGTPAGTQFFYEARIGTDASAPAELVSYKNHLYFVAQATNSSFSRKLYRTDGTNTDNIDAFWPSAKVSSTEVVEVSGNYIYFNGYNSDIGDEIYVSDGTDAGTEGKDIYPFKSFNGTPLSATPNGIVDAGGVLFFNGYWQTKGRDPYYVNGTTLRGAVDVNQNLGNSEARDFTKMGDYVYFSATRDKKTSINGPDNDEGNELWRVKIGSSLPRLVKNIYTGAYNDANPRNLFNWGDSIIFFSATDGSGVTLWKTDGTDAGTVEIKSGVNAPKWFISFKNHVYFVSQNHLWRTDGTFNGTVEVDNTVNITSPFTKINNRLYFTSSDNTYGEELWETDGTKHGTKLVKDINEGVASSSPKNLIVFNKTLYFTATDSIKGEELFSYTDTCNAYAGNVNFTGNVGFCAGDSINLQGTSFNKSAVFSWWYNGNILANNTDSIWANKTGNYRLITDNGNGCIDTSEQIAVTLFTKPSNKILIPNGNSMCKGDVDLIELVPESSTSNYQYQWIENGVDMNNVKDTAIKVNKTSNFQVRITNGGCTITTDTVFTILNELPVPNIPTTNISLCPNTTLTLDPGVFNKYLWETGMDTTQTQVVNTAGNYKVTVTDANSCSASGTFKVVARQKPNVVLTKYGNTFEATSSTGDTYRWLRNGALINGATQNTYSPTQTGNFAVIATSQYGCVDTSGAQSFVLGTENITKLKINVFPNPVNDILTIVFNSNSLATVSITDVQGKLIESYLAKDNITIDVSDLEQGIYFVRINVGGNLNTTKLIKQ